jgi:hypothetical protein
MSLLRLDVSVAPLNGRRLEASRNGFERHTSVQGRVEGPRQDSERNDAGEVEQRARDRAYPNAVDDRDVAGRPNGAAVDEDIAGANRAVGRDLDEGGCPARKCVNLGTRAMGCEGLVSGPELSGDDVLLSAGPGSEQPVNPRVDALQHPAGDQASDGRFRQAELGQLSAGDETELASGERGEMPQLAVRRESWAHDVHPKGNAARRTVTRVTRSPFSLCPHAHFPGAPALKFRVSGSLCPHAHFPGAPALKIRLGVRA